MENTTKTLLGKMLVFSAMFVLLAACGALNNDNNNSDTDSVDGTGDTIRGGETTIYDIQQGRVLPGAEVILKGVIATSGLTYDGGGMFVQDPKGGEYSGVYLYLYEEVASAISPEPGDVINLTGVFEEFYDTTEIKVTSVSSIQIVDKVAPLEPVVVSSSEIGNGGAKSEAFEGVLVKVENVTVSKADLGYGEFEVDSVLRIDDMFFTQNAAPKPSVGETYTSITGPLHYSYETYKIEPRSIGDFEGGNTGGGDPTDTDNTTTDTADRVTVYDIQKGNVALDKTVTIENVVVTSPVGFDGKGFFVQEKDGGAHSGIYIYAYDQVTAAHSPKPGDVVDITGVYTEYYDLSELTVKSAGDFKVTGSADVPAPKVVVAEDISKEGGVGEDFEGVLIQVENATVTKNDLGYGEWEVNSALVVDDYFFDKNSAPMPANGDKFQKIIGPLTYSYGAFKILPRSEADLVVK